MAKRNSTRIPDHVKHQIWNFMNALPDKDKERSVEAMCAQIGAAFSVNVSYSVMRQWCNYAGVKLSRTRAQTGGTDRLRDLARIVKTALANIEDMVGAKAIPESDRIVLELLSKSITSEEAEHRLKKIGVHIDQGSRR